MMSAKKVVRVILNRTYRSMLVLVVVAVVQAGGALGQEAPLPQLESDYFPLDGGMSWSYQGSVFSDVNAHSQVIHGLWTRCADDTQP